MNFDTLKKNGKAISSICPVTGLHIFRKKEWSYRSARHAYTTGIMAGGLIVTRASGITDMPGVKKYCRIMDEIFAEKPHKNHKFIILEGYADLNGAEAKARKHYIDYFTGQSEHVLAVLFYDTTFQMNLSVRLGKALHIVKFNVEIVDTYKDALDRSGELLGMDFYRDPDKKTFIPAAAESLKPDGFSKHLVFDDFDCTVKAMDGDIVHIQTRGILKAAYVAPLFEMHREAVRSLKPNGRPYYYVQDATHTKVRNLRARKMHLSALKALYQDHPFRLCIVYGASRMLRAATMMAAGFVPFEIRIVEDFENADAMVCKDRKADDKPGIGKDLSENPGSPHGDVHLQSYVEALLRFVGGIDWDKKGIHTPIKVEAGHPFLPVFDAISLIKEDLDHLLTSRQAAEEKQRESEEKYRRILDEINDAFFEINLKGDITFCNNALCELLGYPMEAIVGLSFREYIDRDHISDVETMVKRVFETGQPEKAVEYILARKDHSSLHVETSVSLKKDGRGKPIGFRGVIKDISHRKRIEKELVMHRDNLEDLVKEQTREIRQSKAVLQTILDSMPSGVMIVGRDRMIRYANQSALALTGYDSLDQIRGRNCHGIFCQYESDTCPVLAFDEVVDRSEHQLFSKDGKQIFVLKSIIPIHLDNEALLLETFIDITEQKKAIEALRESERRYRLLIKNLPSIVFRGYADWRVDFIGDQIQPITGYTADEFRSGKISWLDIMLDQDLAPAKQIFIKALRNDRSYVREYRIVNKSNNLMWIQERGQIVCNPDGKIEHISGVFFDITEKKHAEKELERSRKAAEAASVSKSEFLANMSHEVRTPLNGIIGMTELALGMDVDDDHRTILETIEKESVSLLDIVNRVLDFSKIEAGKLELDNEPFDLGHLIEDVATSIALRAKGKGLAFACHMAPDMPTRLMGDPGRLRQVLNNLGGNALKFTHKGQVSISVEPLQQTDKMVTIRFEVKDTGIGIPEDRQDSIFDSFTQADGSTTRKYGGTGLGTTISRQLVEMMGGNIGIVSKAGEGATFWFTVVFGFQTEDADALDHDFQDVSELKVLVVDDFQVTLDIVEAYVKRFGCEVHTVQSGAAAIERLTDAAHNNAPFDLVLTDIQMPEMDGYELSEKIKNSPLFEHPFVIALTGLGHMGDGNRCREAGINGYLNKPVNIMELYRTIQTVSAGNGTPRNESDTAVTPYRPSESENKKVNILLVEDYPTNQQVILRHLSGVGYRVDLAENGQEAVDACSENRYDLILMDMQMPVMDGYEATGIIRQMEPKQPHALKSSDHLPIIAMTAHAMKGDREKCIAAGADDYIPKPIRRDELLAMVGKWSSSGVPSTGARERKPVAAAFKRSDTPMDMNRALKEFDDDKSFLDEVLNDFFSNVTRQINLLEKAITDGDAHTVKNQAHSIKGGAANLTAFDLSETALKLENLGKKNKLEKAMPVLDRMRRAHSRLKAYCCQNP